MDLEKRAVVAVVKHEGNILLGRKVADPCHSLSESWHIPGETLKNGESDEEGLIRGIMEEAGIKIRVLRQLANYDSPSFVSVNWYECEALTYNIRPESDLVEVKWVSGSEVVLMCDDNAKELWPNAIQEYFRNKK